MLVPIQTLWQQGHWGKNWALATFCSGTPIKMLVTWEVLSTWTAHLPPSAFLPATWAPLWLVPGGLVNPSLSAWSFSASSTDFLLLPLNVGFLEFSWTHVFCHVIQYLPSSLARFRVWLLHLLHSKWSQRLLPNFPLPLHPQLKLGI